VEEAVLGNIDGTSYGIVPPNYPQDLYPEGDTLCYSNHPGYSSAVNMAISMNGGLVDTSWVNEGEPALIGIHAIPDSLRPYVSCGVSSVPGSDPSTMPLMVDCGTRIVVERTNLLGNNSAFEGLQFPGDFSDLAHTRSVGVDGVFPFESIPFFPLLTDSPWQWWSDDFASGSPSATTAKLTLDTILAYVAPRICLQLGLSCALTNEIVELPSAPGAGTLIIVPNPSTGWFEVSLPALASKPGVLQISDMHGRVVWQQTTKDAKEQVDLSFLPAGLFVVKWVIDNYLYTGKLILQNSK